MPPKNYITPRAYSNEATLFINPAKFNKKNTSKPSFKVSFMFVIITFVLMLTFSAFASEDHDTNEFPYFCELKISYYPEEDGRAYEKFHHEDVNVRAKSKIYHGEHPSHGPYTQLGVRLIGDLCLRNEHNKKIFVDNLDDSWIRYEEYKVEKYKYSLSDFVLVFLDDDKSNEANDDCSDRWWTSFEEGQRVILKVADIWQGMTAHYSTAYAIAPEDIMINGKWICS